MASCVLRPPGAAGPACCPNTTRLVKHYLDKTQEPNETYLQAGLLRTSVLDLVLLVKRETCMKSIVVGEASGRI